MKPHSDKLQNLLHEVLPPAGDHCGPASADVLQLLRGERCRRRRSRRSAALLAGFAVMLSLALWSYHTPAPPPVAHTAPRPAPMIRRVNDEQLFALLKDTPAALVKSPDGTCRLLVLDP